jgi:hypothetical protein
LHSLGETKIQYLDAAFPSDKDVLGFQVAMCDVLSMRRRQAVRNLHRIVNRLALRKGAPGENLAQALTLEQFRNHEGLILIPADIMYCQDVWMAQRGDRARLLLKAPQPFWIDRKGSRQHLDRNLAAEAQVSCPIYLTHPTRADQSYELIGSNVASRRKAHEMSQIIAIRGGQARDLALMAKMKTITAGKNKSDQIDTRTIADLLRCNLLPACYVLSPQLRDLRRLLH